MRRVLGVATVVLILCSAKLAAAQDGWGSSTPQEGAGTEAGGGWGTGTDSGEQNQGETGGGWGTETEPQAADNESATGGSSGWGSSTSSGSTRPASTPAATTSPGSTSVSSSSATESEGLTGSAFRLAHRIALGVHQHMSGAFLAAHDGLGFGFGGPGFGEDLHSITPWLNVSFMYHFNERLTLDVFFGFTVGTYVFADDDGGVHEDGDKITSFELGFGPRLLITLAEGDNGRLYTGVGIGLLIGMLNGSADRDTGACPGGLCGGWDAYGMALSAPLGVEYRFRRLPNLAISAEVNFHFVFQSVGVRYPDSGPDDIVSEAEYNHIVVGLGNARQPGSFNFLDILTFLTFGFHWLI